MKDQIISFETAKLAKKKGFNEPCLECYVEKGTLYNNNREGIEFTNKQLLITNCSAPTQSLLQRWLREIHNIDIIIWKNGIDGSYRVEDILLNNKEITNLEFEDSFDNYENALEEGLYEALKLI